MSKPTLDTTIRVSDRTKRRLAKALKSSDTLGTPDDLINQMLDDREDFKKNPVRAIGKFEEAK